MLDGDVSRMFADHHDVRVGAVAQVAGNGGLGQHQQIVAGGEFRKHVLAQPQHAQPTRRVDRRLPAAHRAALIAQQHEMPVGQPAQQRGDVLAVGAGEAALGVGVEFVGQAPQCGGHRARIERHLAGVGENVGQQALGLGQRLAVHRPRQLDVDPRLVDPVLRCGVRRRLNLQQLPCGPAAHPEHGVHDRRVGHTEPVQQHRYGVHQHRRVVGDDL